jgi:AcrR family transcriptional regulator
VTEPRRIGAEDSATRAQLLDAAQALMVEDGYASVTSRRVAAKAGLKPQLVHYYFRTMDDLFLALVRRGAEQNLERQDGALASPQPLRALWEFSKDPAGVTLTMEFTALANHRKAIRSEWAAYAREFRHRQQAALATIVDEYGIDTEAYPLDALLFALSSFSRVLVIEESMGVDVGHDDARALVERLITTYEGPSATKG